MGDMGRCCYQEEVASQLCFYYALPEWGILVLYTLGETEGETEREREGDGRGTTHFIKHRYTATRMSALAAGTKRSTPPVGTTDHFHTAPHDHEHYVPEEFEFCSRFRRQTRCCRSTPRLFF